MVNFKNRYSFKARKAESEKMRRLYPNKIPVICEKNPKDKDLPSSKRKKYLISKDITCGQFMSIMRSRVNLGPEKAMFLFIDNIIPGPTSNLSELFIRYKDPDGFLYIVYTGENAFGE